MIGNGNCMQHAVIYKQQAKHQALVSPYFIDDCAQNSHLAPTVTHTDSTDLHRTIAHMQQFIS